VTPRLKAVPNLRTVSDLRNRVECLIGQKLVAVENDIAQILHSPYIPISEMGAYLSVSRGKRLRPTLLLLVSRLLGYEGEKEVRYASIYELIHTASLIHDDIVDQALLRRGQPSFNARYGAEMAVLMGDYVFTLALSLANRYGEGHLLTLISDTTVRLVQGELLQKHHKWDLTLSRENYIEILACKTAHLFSACAETPAILTESEPSVRTALRDFGLNLGLAFQIVDDCLDFSSDEATLGKPVCSDLREGKVTLPLLLMMESGISGDRAFLEAVVTARRFDQDTLLEVVSRARRSGKLKEAEQIARDFTDKALEALDRLPAGEIREMLAHLPDFVLYRKS